MNGLAGRIMFVFAWVMFFMLLVVFFRFYDTKATGSFEVSHGIITITPDSQGHYYLMGAINATPIKFMLDTGATYVGVPEGLAHQLQLEKLYPVTLETANGPASGWLTRIKLLKVAEYPLQNVQAVIMPGNQENIVLLGMNVLSRFKITQRDKQLVMEPIRSQHLKDGG